MLLIICFHMKITITTLIGIRLCLPIMLQQVRASREHVQGQGTRMAKGRGHFAAEAHQGRGVGQNTQKCTQIKEEEDHTTTEATW